MTLLIRILLYILLQQLTEFQFTGEVALQKLLNCDKLNLFYSVAKMILNHHLKNSIFFFLLFVFL